MRKTSSSGLVRLTTLDAIRKTIQHDIAELRKAVATANHTITIANANLERLEKLVDGEKQPDLVIPAASSRSHPYKV